MKKYYEIYKLATGLNKENGSLAVLTDKDMCSRTTSLVGIVENEKVAKDFCKYHTECSYKEIAYDENKY